MTNTYSLFGKSAVITGAGSGIGRAIATRLAACGVHLCLIGRTAAKLETLRVELAIYSVNIHLLPCDLDQDNDVRRLSPRIQECLAQVDILIHSAGAIRLGAVETVTPGDIDHQYRVNVRAPLLITQSLLASLRVARGQVVFINSSLGVRTKEHAGVYAATKHAQKALADTLRMEINSSGVRVISVFPGNTATAMQEEICRSLGQPYRPEGMLQPDDVATAVVNVLQLPASAELTDLHIRPARKPETST